ncbi:MAG: alpha/beta hydrolase-fold protein [Polyangiaceae bacterium]|nr:alpha/beta hydrolase-fold protein [Polyangiaceae bacterium]
MAVDRRVGRRTCIAGLLGLATLPFGCSRRGCNSDAGSDTHSIDTSQIVLHQQIFDQNQGGPQKAVVMVPAWASAENRLPLLIALHGRGESNRGLDVGAWAWVRDYWLNRTAARLRVPPLTREDLLGIGPDSYLGQLNESLTVHPWQGLIVVCPHTTDILSDRNLDAAAPYADFLVDHLIPKIRADFPVISTREATGIDGVSLGGRMALLSAVNRPEAFGAVGTLQAAFRAEEVQEVASQVKKAWQQPVHPSALRVLTSHDDYFLPTLDKLAKALADEPVNAQFRLIPGRHDYEFNRGPGGYEMLVWHDRVLRGGSGS